jgi:hypothetical protein
MAVLPVPDIVRQMAGKIDSMIGVLESHGTQLNRIRGEVSDVSNIPGQVKDVNKRLDRIEASLKALQDSMRMVTAYIEGKR